MAKKLRVGVLGLGRRWQRYRAALEGPESPVEVRAVCDPLPQRTDEVARHLNCDAADGTVELLDRDDVDAVLVFGTSWQGLWPLQRASELGKPIFCASAALCDRPGVNALRDIRNEHSPPVMVALTAALTPAVGRLRVLLDTHLGPARLVCCRARLARSATSQLLRAGSTLLPMLHLCRELLPGQPETVWAAAPDNAGLLNLTFGCSDGSAAQVMVTTGRTMDWRITVQTEKGYVEVTLPRQVRWVDPAGTHCQRLLPRSLPELVLRHFVESVRAGKPARPSLDDACAARAWLQAARRSHTQGRAVSLLGLER